MKTVKITEKENNVEMVEITTTEKLPRYYGNIISDEFYSNKIMDLIHYDCKIWTGVRNYSNLKNYEIDREELQGNTLEEDLDIFQRILDDEYGKENYEAFVLGAYIHGRTSFSINKSGNHDSSQLGFIGIPTDKNKMYNTEGVGLIEKDLTSAWNGEYYEYQIIDRLENDVVDSIITDDWTLSKDFREKAITEYNVDFDKIEIQY